MQIEVLQWGQGQEASPAGHGAGGGRVFHGGGGVLQDNGRNQGELDVLGAGYAVMWVNWVYPPWPAYVMWAHCGFVGASGGSWPSGLAAWPAPLASLPLMQIARYSFNIAPL
jgi:hypothetical protein